MKPLRLLRSALLLSLVVWQASCSSEDKKTTSGGAHFRLTGAVGAGSGACLDPIANVTIAVRGEDGKDKLIPDGADGANVTCAYNEDRFSVIVGGNAGGVTAEGTFSGTGKMQSTDATMTIVMGGSGNTYKTTTKKCTITFTKKSDNALLGRFICPQVDYTRDGTKVCAVTALAADGFTPESYFQFADCGSL